MVRKSSDTVNFEAAYAGGHAQNARNRSRRQ